LADKANERHRHEITALAKAALAKKQHHGELAEHAGALATLPPLTQDALLACNTTLRHKMALTDQQMTLTQQQFASKQAALVSAKERHHQELAELAVALAESVLAKEQRCRQEAVKRTAALAESELAKEQRLQELVERTMALAEMASIANKEAAKHAMALAAKASANNKEASGRMWDLSAAYMVATVFVVDTRHQEMAGAVQQPRAAQCWCCCLWMTKPWLQPCRPWHPQWLCCHPPPALLHMWVWSFPP
jgi:hypothetical protein